MPKLDILKCWDSYKMKLKNLTPDQVRQIDDFLGSVGEYGEVSLIVQHGELRYINRVESHKVWMSQQEKD